MNGIASLLDEAANSRVEQIWQELESRCGLRGVRLTPFPHITWQVTEGYNFLKLERILRYLSRDVQPFVVHTAGLGIFTGPNPVVYISVFKDRHLIRLHSRLWELTKGFVANPDPLYAPSRWIPHITVAYNDVNAENLHCVLQALAFRAFDWDIKINSFIYIGQVDEHTVESGKYELGK